MNMLSLLIIVCIVIVFPCIIVFFYIIEGIKYDTNDFNVTEEYTTPKNSIKRSVQKKSDGVEVEEIESFSIIAKICFSLLVGMFIGFCGVCYMLLIDRSKAFLQIIGKITLFLFKSRKTNPDA